MSAPTILPDIARAGRLLAVLILMPGALAAADPDVAIFARAYNGYTRTRLPDNSFKPESYVFADGGRHGGEMVDHSIDDLSFYDVAHVIAGPLRKRGYVPSFDPKHTELAIFVFWGTTSGAERSRFSEGEAFLQDAMREYWAPPASQSAAQRHMLGTTEANADAHAESMLEQALMLQSLTNRQRDQKDFYNAGILGYREALKRAWEIPWFSLAQDVITELEEDRYFVVLKAFDFHALAVEKRWKLMWEARFSIPARHNAFDQQLAAMAMLASQYFGQDEQRLIRQAIKEGRVEIGTPTVIETDVK